MHISQKGKFHKIAVKELETLTFSYEKVPVPPCARVLFNVKRTEKEQPTR